MWKKAYRKKKDALAFAHRTKLNEFHIRETDGIFDGVEEIDVE
jgi:hypothetical protein